MKHLLNGVAIAAAIVIAVPVWAQSPTGGNAVGTPGPNPGGPGLTPYSGGAPQYNPATPGATGVGAPMPSTSAMPPMHHAMHMHHPMHHMAKKKAPQLAGDTTSALNREELARIQAGNLGNPPAPPMPGGPSGMPGPKTQ